MSDDLNLFERILVRKEINMVLKKYWPTIVSVAGAALPFLLPSLAAYEGQHAKTIGGILCAAIIAAYHSTAPKDANIVNPK